MQVLRFRKKGATGLSYGLLVGLIAVTSIVAISTSGSSVTQLFNVAGDAVIGIVPSPQPGGGGASGPAPVITTTTLGPFTEDTTPASVQLAVTDGGASPNFSVTSGSLPPGMSLSGSGELTSSGIPAVSGDGSQSYNFTVTVTNTDNNETGQQAYAVTVCPVVVLSSPASLSAVTVPAECGSVQALIWGGGGAGSGDGASVTGYDGGPGGFTSMSLTLSAPGTIYATVGNGGSQGVPGVTNQVTPRTTHGEGGAGISWGGGGGGYSALFSAALATQGNVIAVAGGGGGGGVKCVGEPNGFEGSAGGGSTGVTYGTAAETAGSGTQSAGGVQGPFDNTLFGDAEPGSALRGGDGHVATTGSNWGGGGGGGYWGGGGGGVNNCRVGGGGGGSGFVNTSFGTGSTSGSSSGLTPPGTGEARYVSGAGEGGATSGSVGGNLAGDAGSDGLIVLVFGQ